MRRFGFGRFVMVFSGRSEADRLRDVRVIKQFLFDAYRDSDLTRRDFDILLDRLD